MGERRRVDLYCETCQEVARAVVSEADPGSCECTVCGTVQLLMVPVDE